MERQSRSDYLREQAEEAELETQAAADAQDPLLDVEMFGDWLGSATLGEPKARRDDTEYALHHLRKRGPEVLDGFDVAELLILLLNAENPEITWVAATIKARYLQWASLPPLALATAPMAYSILSAPLQGRRDDSAAQPA